jgi:hypothetical protein
MTQPDDNLPPTELASPPATVSIDATTLPHGGSPVDAVPEVPGYVIEAVLGLDRHQRDEAERRLLAELRNATGERQVDLAWAATTPDRLAPETAKVAGAVLLGVLGQTTEGGAQNKLAQGLAALIVQMEPGAARTIGEQTAAILNEGLAKSLNAGTLRSLAEALATLAATLQALAESVAAVAARLAPDEALRAAQFAADTLLKALTRQTDESVIPDLAWGLLHLAPWLGPKHALLLSTCFGRTSDTRNAQIVTLTLSAILAREQPEKARRRSAVAVALVGQGEPWAWLTAAGALPVTAPEPPPPLPAQTLVDLLRDPLSIGPARRPILDQLARHYNRTFTDQWEFVTFAQERKFHLDLLGPAPRP